MAQKIALGGGECSVVVEFVVEVVVVVPVVAPSWRWYAVVSPRPAVADLRVSRGPTGASAWRPATVRMNIRSRGCQLERLERPISVDSGNVQKMPVRSF